MMKFLTRWLLVAAIVIWPSIGHSALPNQLKTARMTDATLASAIDNEVGNLETAVCDILGIPCNTNVSNALFVVTASGLTNVVFQDLVGSPTAAGRLARNAANLEFHDGTAARVLANAINTLTFTNKTINLASNTLVGDATQFNTALTGDDFLYLAGNQTTTNKTINLASNILIGTTAQFNTALSDNDFATLAGIETLTNKTLTSPTITGMTLSGATVSGAAPATPTANVLYTDSFIKGWLETSGGGAWTIDADVNVSSITDNGVGDLTLNWATAFATANYTVVGGTIHSFSGGGGNEMRLVFEDPVTAKTASLVRMRVVNSSFALADPSVGVSVMAIGAQ